MNIFTICALVVATCTIFFSRGESEETSRVHDRKESGPENDVTKVETDDDMYEITPPV